MGKVLSLYGHASRNFVNFTVLKRHFDAASFCTLTVQHSQAFPDDWSEVIYRFV